MDDVIVATKPCKLTYLRVLKHFFTICRQNGIKLKGSKCFLCFKNFKYLGHGVDRGKLTASPHYVLKLKNIQYEKIVTKTDLRWQYTP